MGVTYKTGKLDADGEEEELPYDDKVPMFLEGGASSNDV